MSRACVYSLLVLASVAAAGCQNIGKKSSGGYVLANPRGSFGSDVLGRRPAGADVPAVRADVKDAEIKLEALRAQIAQAQDTLALKAGGLYEVKKGDSLWKIAGRPDVYNSTRLWIKIWSANRDIIRKPDAIYPGQMLIIRDRLPLGEAARN